MISSGVQMNADNSTRCLSKICIPPGTTGSDLLEVDAEGASEIAKIQEKVQE